MIYASTRPLTPRLRSRDRPFFPAQTNLPSSMEVAVYGRSSRRAVPLCHFHQPPFLSHRRQADDRQCLSTRSWPSRGLRVCGRWTRPAAPFPAPCDLVAHAWLPPTSTARCAFVRGFRGRQALPPGCLLPQSANRWSGWSQMASAYLWERPRRRPVSLAAKGRRSRPTVSPSATSTRRASAGGRGYASALVAGLSQVILDEGWPLHCLHRLCLHAARAPGPGLCRAWWPGQPSLRAMPLRPFSPTWPIQPRTISTRSSATGQYAITGSSGSGSRRGRERHGGVIR